MRRLVWRRCCLDNLSLLIGTKSVIVFARYPQVSTVNGGPRPWFRIAYGKAVDPKAR